MNIGGTRVVAQTSLPLQAGQTLQLQVLQNGELPILKILDRLPAGNPTTDALRFALPRQGGLPPLLANLTLLSQNQGQNLPGLNTRLTTLSEQIINQLTPASRIASGPGIRQAVLNSGLFLEAKLMAQVQGSNQNLARDFKAGLLKLHESLLSSREQLPMVEIKSSNQFIQPANSPRPPIAGNMPQAQASAQPTLTPTGQEGNLDTLLRQVESALARIQLGQLASLPTDQNNAVWMLEVPVRFQERTDLVQMKIKRDGSKNANPEQQTWSIDIAFDLENLGAIHANIRYAQERISAIIWAEREQTQKLFSSHLQELRAQLGNAGLDIAALEVKTGTPKTQQVADTPARLIDVQA